MDPEIIEFLQQSNYIEGVLNGLDQAVKAWQYIIRYNILTMKRLLQTHKILMYKQNMKRIYRGHLRTTDVSIGHWDIISFTNGSIIKHFVATGTVTPSLLVPRLLKQWIQAVNLQTQIHKAPGLDDVFKLSHIEFEKIHPFFDGNGRMGRILLNWQRKQSGLPILVIREEDKKSYYQWFAKKGGNTQKH